MNRLTYKLNEQEQEEHKTKYLKFEYFPIPDYCIEKGNSGRITSDMIYNKLGKLEDLEEQLGCPLDFIFKVLKAPKIYIEGMNVRSEYDDSFKFNSKSNNYIINPYAIDGKKPEFLFVDRWGYGYDLRLKDYKKTWFLKEDKSE